MGFGVERNGTSSVLILTSSESDPDLLRFWDWEQVERDVGGLAEAKAAMKR
jgi:hypothetical protein